MKRTPLAQILLAMTMLLNACTPIVMLPGVRLGGSEVPTPSSWSDVEIPEEVLIRTEGGWVPWVHRIWAAKSDEGIYVAGEPGSRWVERALAEPNVQLRVGDDVYTLRATQIDDLQKQREATAIFLAKYREGMLELYGEEPDPEEMAGEAVVFLLARR